MKLTVSKCLLIVAVLASLVIPAVAAPKDLDAREQKAFQNAVQEVAPSIVRIETLSRVGNDELSRMIGGPTSGVVVEKDGLIITSAAPFVSKPGTVLVQTPDGQRYAAKLLGVDFLRMLALLKIDAKNPLPVPTMAPAEKIRVGNWAIAVGRAFDGTKPNMTVGIVSGLGRIGNKAIQTDATTSPNNYGGPLINVEGQVMGIVAPLSRNTSKKVDVGWYDSGIGFAVPMDQVLQDVVPRLKKGKDLKAGSLGVVFMKSDPNTSDPIVMMVPDDTAAKKAKIASGDRIVAVDGKPVNRVIELNDALGTKYAGETVTITVDRDGKRIDAKVTLEVPKPPKKKKKPGHPGMKPGKKPPKKKPTKKPTPKR
ncbi:MAG: trypsin-like peptidase domain-containing protein [Planctomycetia bacterium]|jgi:serine protease Do